MSEILPIPTKVNNNNAQMDANKPSFFSVKEALLFGLRITKSRPWFVPLFPLFLKLVAVMFMLVAMVVIVGGIFLIFINGDDPSLSGWGGFMGGLIIVMPMMIVLGIFGTMMSTFFSLEILTDRSASYKSIFMKSWNVGLFFDYFIAIMLVVVMTIIGFFFFIVPGIIVALSCIFVPFLVLDKKMGAIEAIKESFEMTKGFKVDLFIFALAVIGINIMGSLTIGGWIITAPVTTIALVFIYFKMRGESERIVSVEEYPWTRLIPVFLVGVALGVLRIIFEIMKYMASNNMN